MAATSSGSTAWVSSRQIHSSRHDVGLRDGLVWVDRQRGVLVGEFDQIGRHEPLAIHLPHGPEEPGVADPARHELLLNHPVANRE